MSSTQRNLQGEQRKLVFWFTSEDVENPKVWSWQDGIERFIADTKIEGRALKSAKESHQIRQRRADWWRESA